MNQAVQRHYPRVQESKTDVFPQLPHVVWTRWFKWTYSAHFQPHIFILRAPELLCMNYNPKLPSFISVQPLSSPTVWDEPLQLPFLCPSEGLNSRLVGVLCSQLELCACDDHIIEIASYLIWTDQRVETKKITEQFEVSFFKAHVWNREVHNRSSLIS